MVLKVYLTILSLFAAAVALLFATGNFHGIAAVTSGFVAFGLIFMGMMFVLPFTVSHPAPAAAKKDTKEFAPAPAFSAVPAQSHGAQPLTERVV